MSKILGICVIYFDKVRCAGLYQKTKFIPLNSFFLNYESVSSTLKRGGGRKKQV